MKVLLMHPDRDFDPKPTLPAHAQALAEDLEVDSLLGAIGGDDEFLVGVARAALFGGFDADVPTVLHRQAILRDGLAQPQVVRELYALAVEALDRKRKGYFGIFMHYPSAILRGSLETLRMFVEMLRKLRDLARAHEANFESPGMRTLFATLQRELGDDYLAEVRAHLDELKLDRGVLISAELGDGNEGVRHVLRLDADRRPTWLRRLLGQGRPSYSFRLAERDDAGARFLGELQDRGINLVANALAQSMDHIASFFELLRAELGFYVGALNLHERLSALGVPVALPEPNERGARTLRFAGLVDPCLALQMQRAPVGNDVDADGRGLVVVTGANQGGKSSFLRAVGVAQLMMQCGLFVAAERYAGSLCAGLFTHHKREEDATMTSGKFDEELKRLDAIADSIRADALVLFNESFASTNEREGSEVGRQVVDALLESRVRVFFVTHQYEFARSYLDRRASDVLYLRAERLEDGRRSFKLVPGEPLPTSYGEDLYAEVFGAGPAPA